MPVVANSEASTSFSTHFVECATAAKSGWASNAAWAATVDSLRKDLVRLPELSGAELTAMMPAHMARITRLSEMHQKMMRDKNA